MSDADLSVAAAIVRNIDLLEATYDYVGTKIDPVLGQAVGTLLARKRDDFGWVGDVEMTFEGSMYLAPSDWRTAEDEEDAFDLYFVFDAISENDLYWVANFVGVEGTGVGFEVLSDTGTKAAVRRTLRRIFGADQAILETLRTSGFSWSPQGDLTMPVTISREALAAAFENEDFDTALAPVAEALDRIHAARKHLDLLVDRIRGEAG